MASEYTEIRLSHLLRNCSVGAVVRGPDYLMVVEDTGRWQGRDKQTGGKPLYYVDQVRSMLGLTQTLREPPVAQQGPDGNIRGDTIPAMRFPGWMRCPRCGLLHHKPWRTCRPDELPRCGNTLSCSGRPVLEQVQWVMVHAQGYLAEVSWHYLSHQTDSRKNSGSVCRSSFTEPYLFLNNRQGGVNVLRCGKCKAQAEFRSGSKISYGSAWQQPWYNEPAPGPEGLASILAVNDARLHIPETKSALVIPPESRIQQQSVVGQLYTSTGKLRRLHDAVRPLHKKAVLKQVAAELKTTAQEIQAALTEIDKGFPLYGQKISRGDLFETEYEALIEPIPGNADDEDFVTRHHSAEWQSLITDLTLKNSLRCIAQSVDRLVEVRRLKEIMVLTGFKRLDGNTLIPPDLTGDLDWLPALELYGEGLFFTLDTALVNKRAEIPELLARAGVAADKIKKHDISFENQPAITPQFIFLHTLAHLVIRQLENTVGYPASSLSERIYCQAGKNPMAGILIYVAVPDVVGSLGGLAEMAQPQRFLPLLSAAFDHAQWCSLDPVCSEHAGQGPAQINRAACHACTLVPETTCDYGNLLLDRTFVKGDIKTGVTAFPDV